MKVLVRMLAALGVLLTLGGCSNEPKNTPLEVQSSMTWAATVETVDLQRRLVVLKGENGRRKTIEVPPQIRNLEQVQVGDQLVVRYVEAVAAELKRKGVEPTPATIDSATATTRAPEGMKPGAAAGNMVLVTAVIDTVERDGSAISFVDSTGELRTVNVQPRAQAFAKGLQRGDEVEVAFTEAVAVSVEPAT